MTSKNFPALLFICICGLFRGGLVAQEMQPRAYLPSPIGVGFAGVGYSYNAGGQLFDPSLPVEDARVKAHVPSLSVGGSLNTYGRSSQLLVVLPYVTANLNGKLAGSERSIYRSGLADITMRYAINLFGAPAMTRKEYSRYRQKTVVGASITATSPIGQYDPNLLINIGTNRWGVKPELGVSRAIGQWIIEGAFGVWLYTKNQKYAGNNEQRQRPLWSTQSHVVRVIQRRHWLAFDFTYFQGGETLVNGRVAATYQANTRMGGTYGVLLSPRQALRFSYFSGVSTRIGSDLNSVGVAYQFLWATGR